MAVHPRRLGRPLRRAILCAALALPLFANAGRADERLYDESAAFSEGASPFRLNPAGISVRYPSEFALSYVDDPRQRARFGGSLEASGFRFALTGSADDHLGYALGHAGGRDALRLGGQFASAPRAGGGRYDDWRFGALSRPAPWLSVGATAEHVNQPHDGLARLDRGYDLGLAIRPFAFDRGRAHGLGTRLTLTGDARLAERSHPADAAFRAGAELEIVPGVVARASYEDRTHGFTLGVGLLGVRTRTDEVTRYTRDNDRLGSVMTFASHGAEDRTALAGRRDRRIAVVHAGGVLGDDELSGVTYQGTTHSIAAASLHAQLQRALEDPLTRGVLLDLRGVGNLAQLEELRPRIERLRAAHKPVVAFIEAAATRGDLYLASACDRVVSTPEAAYQGLGVLIEQRYYHSFLAKLGLRLDRTSYGEYKSAYREYSVDSTTAADRESFDHLIDARQELFVSAVAEGRRMDRAKLLEILDGRPWSAADARRAGLVDSLGYANDAVALAGTLAGLGARPRTANLARHPVARSEWTRPGRVAVIYASGAIDLGPSGGDLFMGPTLGSETLVRQIEAAFRDRGVRAVVFRVESPGGVTIASGLMQHALMRMKRETKKPLIVSMGRSAGSGGYQIALPGDRIYADRFTSTGSIGVLFVRPSLEGFYRKHDIHQDDFIRGDYMRAWALGHDWDARMQAVADTMIMRDYREFVTLVADARRLPWDEVERSARGRVWTGDDAVRLKLVDEIGGLDAAIAEARRRANIPAGESIRLVEFRRPRGGWIQRATGTLVREGIESMSVPELGRSLWWDDRLDLGD